MFLYLVTIARLRRRSNMADAAFISFSLHESLDRQGRRAHPCAAVPEQSSLLSQQVLARRHEDRRHPHQGRMPALQGHHRLEKKTQQVQTPVAAKDMHWMLQKDCRGGVPCHVHALCSR